MASTFFFEDTIFWSEGDENALFSWLESLDCFVNGEGVANRMYFEIQQDKVDPEQWWELHAIYKRYGGDTNQLETLPARRAISVHEQMIAAGLDDEFEAAVAGNDFSEVDRILALVNADRNEIALHWLLRARIDNAQD